MGDNSEARKAWQNLLKKQQNFSFIPKDAYSHQASLLYPHSLTIEEFGDLLNQHLLLGYIPDEDMLNYYQEELYFITSIFAMMKEEREMLEPLFNLMYYPYVMGIRMTTCLDGMERQMQSFAYKSTRKRRSVKDKLLGRRKHQTPLPPEYEDMLLPEEEYY